jgi:peptide/nickel transport system substrate-binding protein
MNVNDPYVRYYAMNLSAGHMDCIEVRKAFFFAINTQALIDLAGGSTFYGAPGDSIMKPNLGPDYAKTTGNIHEPYWSINGNPTKAKEFLEAAKTKCAAAYTRATSTGIIMDLPNTASNQKGSVLIEDAMKAAGIAIKFNFIPSGTYYATVRDVTKQNDISSVGWGPDWANASTVIPELFIKGGGGNYTQTWNDPAYAAFKVKSDKASAETNRAKQIKMWQELGQTIMDNYWIGRPVFTKTQLSWGSKVGGVGFWDPQGTFLFPALYVKN